MRRNTGRLVALLSAGLLTLGLAASAAAYHGGEVLGSVSIRIEVTATCPGTGTLAARATDISGAGVANEEIRWELTEAVAGDALNPTTSVTDANGDARTTLTLGSTVGQRTVKATATRTGTSGSATFTCQAAGGLPNTALGAPVLPLQAIPYAAVIGGGMSIFALAALRRRP